VAVLGLTLIGGSLVTSAPTSAAVVAPALDLVAAPTPTPTPQLGIVWVAPIPGLPKH
jgi:hypothetical protein